MALVSEMASAIETSELATIDELQLVDRLHAYVQAPDGISLFAKLFHPIRYSFVHVNFIVGARQEMHEIFWAGLARNLYEEAGGGITSAHNELYRNFLRSIGLQTDHAIREVGFSRQFNRSWRRFARHEPVDRAVLAVAIYEILDRPDYISLYKGLSGINPKWDLEFFKIHSLVEHFDMFSEFVEWYFDHKETAQADFDQVADFVLGTQKQMWSGLLARLDVAQRARRRARGKHPSALAVKDSSLTEGAEVVNAG